MRKTLSIALVALLMGVGLFPGLGEMAMVNLSIEQLSQEADTIVLGTVTKRVSAWNNLHTAIYTNVTVTVGEAIKGAPGSELIVQITGGTVGDIGMRTSTAPEIHDGDQVILFLQTASVPAALPANIRGHIR
jgi:hypothetical protein